MTSPVTGSDDSSLDQSATSIQILLRSRDTFLIKLRLYHCAYCSHCDCNKEIIRPLVFTFVAFRLKIKPDNKNFEVNRITFLFIHIRFRKGILFTHTTQYINLLYSHHHSALIFLDNSIMY